MPELDRHETRLVFEVVAIELRAQQESVCLRAPVLGLHVAEQALDPRRGRLPTSRTPMHGDSLVAVRLPDKPLCRLLGIVPVSTGTVRGFSDVSARKKREPGQMV